MKMFDVSVTINLANGKELHQKYYTDDLNLIVDDAKRFVRNVEKDTVSSLVFAFPIEK